MLIISFQHLLGSQRGIFVLDNLVASAKNCEGEYSNYIYFAESRLTHFVKEHSDVVNSD